MKNTNKYKYQLNKVIFNNGIKKVRVPKVNPPFLVWSPIICCLVAIEMKSVISKSIIICNILCNLFVQNQFTHFHASMKQSYSTFCLRDTYCIQHKNYKFGTNLANIG